MRASLVIAGHNEGDNLWRTVGSCLEGADGLDCEVLVADDDSTDGSIAELRRFPQVHLVAHEERRGASPTKDLGARCARGDVLVFLDGHCKPEPGALARLVADVEAADGRAVVTPAVPALDTERWENKPHQVGHGYRIDLERFDSAWVGLDRLRPSAELPWLRESPALIGCCLAVTRDLYERLRGFDADMRFWGVEDLDFGLKAWLMGHPILHDPGAAVGHRFRAGFDNYGVPMEHVVANRLRMARKNLAEPAWEDWVRRARGREPVGLWEPAWAAFEARRSSAEREREYLLSRRVHDEFWYAERFGLDWPPAALSGRFSPRVMTGPPAAAVPPPRGAEPAAHAAPGGGPAGGWDDDPRELFLEHYRHPRNRQALADPDATGAAHAPGGAVLTLYLKLGRAAGGSARIERAAFESRRCGVAVAYASLLTELVTGRTVEQAREVTPSALVGHFGERAGAYEPAALAVAALHRALEPAARPALAAP